MDKKLIVIACSKQKQGTVYKDREGNDSYGFIERISQSKELGGLESYPELTKKRESILIEYNKKEISKNITRESSAFAVYEGKQYKYKFNDLKEIIRKNRSKYDVLIVSTLYGIVHFSDKNYPYEVKDMKKYWNGEADCEILRKIILEYYKEKNFIRCMCFYLKHTLML